MSTQNTSAAPSAAKRLASTLVDLIRGALVGLTEIIPGVSGGTVALIIGVYDTLIDGAGNLARAAGALLRGRGFARAGEYARAVKWSVVLPVGIGILLAIFAGARVISPLVEEYPVHTRALFAGLIAASLIVPARMSGGTWRVKEWVIAAIAAGVLFFLISLPTNIEFTDPPLVLVALAAAVAVCALVLPGVSGSYLLLTFGLYAPTLVALNTLNLPYIFTFIAGGVVGLALFVPVLQWLLHHRRRITLVIMTGLMAGSLRAVWPWQTENNELLAPQSNWPAIIGLFVVGVAIVIALLVVEQVLAKRGVIEPEQVA